MAVPIYETNRVLARHSLSEWLMYHAADDEQRVFYSSDGRLGAIWQAPPLLGLPPEIIGNLHGLFDRDMPVGTTMQWQYFASPCIEPLLDAYVEMRTGGGSSTLFHELAERERDFYIKGRDTYLVKSSRIRPRSCSVYVSVSIPLKGRASHGVPEEDALRALEGVQAGLEAIWSGALTRLDGYGLKLLLFQLLNPGHAWADRPLAYDPTCSLSEQVVSLDTECRVHPDCLELDQRCVKVLTVRQFPQEWHGSHNRDLVGRLLRPADQIRCPFLLSFNCIWLDPEKTKSAVTQKHLMIHNQASKSLLNLIPRLREKKEQFDWMQQSLSEGHRPLGMYFSLFLYDETFDELERHTQEVMGLYTQLGWDLQIDQFVGLPVFLHSLPLHMPNDADELRDRLRRLKTLHSEVACHLVPAAGDWKGLGAPVFLGITRSGQLFAFDLFGNRMGGFSMTVAGQTGSGKSFFTNKLLMSYLGVGARVWVIDLGHSYEKLCAQVNGQWIEIKHERNLCFNPFSFLTFRDDMVREEKGQLGQIFEQMIAPHDGLSDLQRSFLQEAIDAVCANEGSGGSPESVGKVLESHADGRVRDLAQMLRNFRAGGMYERLFNGTGNLEFDNPFVVMELEGFEGSPDLLPVLLLQLVMTVQSQVVSLDRAIRKICTIDEGWRFLSTADGGGGGGNKNVSQFFVLGARTFRKYGGCILTVSQGVNDYFEQMGRNGVAIWENSDFTALLGQKPESVQALRNQKRLHFGEYEFQQLQTVHKHGEEYSEVMLISPMGRGIVQIVVDDYTRYLYSTKAEDVSRLTQYQRNGMTLLQAIDQCIREDKGVSYEGS